MERIWYLEVWLEKCQNALTRPIQGEIKNPSTRELLLRDGLSYFKMVEDTEPYPNSFSKPKTSIRPADSMLYAIPNPFRLGTPREI